MCDLYKRTVMKYFNWQQLLGCSHGRCLWLDVFAGQCHSSPLQFGKKKHGLHLLLINKPLETLNKILPSFFGNKIFIFSVLDLTQHGSSSDEAPGFQSYSWAGCKLISKLYAKQMPGTLKKFSKDCHGSFLKLEWVTCTNWQSFRVGFYAHTHTHQSSKIS